MIQAAQHPGDELWDPSWDACLGEQTIQDRSSDSAAITLYCSWFCPFAQRAWIALEEKQIAYQYVEVNPYEVDASAPGGYTKKQLPLEKKQQLYPDFVAASPRGLVPAISHIRQHVWESIHVVEYIDSVFSNHCTERIQKAYYAALMSQEPAQQKESLERFYEECRLLARAMAPEQNGAFFLGETFSLVDIALAPFWQRFLIVGGHYRGLKFPDKELEFRRLRVWWNAVKMRPSVAATFVCPERLIASYAQYASNEATSDFASMMSTVISSANAASAHRASTDGGAGSSRGARPPRSGSAGASTSKSTLGEATAAVGGPPSPPPMTAVVPRSVRPPSKSSGSKLRGVAAFALGAAATLLVQKAQKAD